MGEEEEGNAFSIMSGVSNILCGVDAMLASFSADKCRGVHTDGCGSDWLPTAEGDVQELLDGRLLSVRWNGSPSLHEVQGIRLPPANKGAGFPIQPGGGRAQHLSLPFLRI